MINFPQLFIFPVGEFLVPGEVPELLGKWKRARVTPGAQTSHCQFLPGAPHSGPDTNTPDRRRYSQGSYDHASFCKNFACCIKLFKRRLL